MSNAISEAWRTAITPPRRDPLAIDLDGDGIETVGISATGNAILFDHDANGVKTGTGWVAADDAWLVLDRDGNGSIDSGRELCEGVDTVRSSVTWMLGAELENLVLTGSSAINGTGNVAANRLFGNAAANVLDGGAGADILTGGAGNDVYVVDSASNSVLERQAEGTDTVQSGVTWALGANVENLTLTGATAVNGTGNELSNVLTGNGAANTLAGAAGNDTLDGGAGADILNGGTGDDSYMVDTAGDVVTEAANEGIDTVNAGVDWTLGANFENLVLTGAAAVNGTGNALDNLLTGNGANNILVGGTGNDTLDGGAGADTLNGGTGNDSYVVDAAGDVATEAASEGTDTVYAGVNWALGANFENLVLTGAAAISGTGNALDNLLTGNSANNTLAGGAGNDTLNGGAGNDSMAGGAGDDSFAVDSSSDTVTELAGEGTDTVQSSVTFTLGANVENLTLTGTGAINGTGNASDNVLTGNSAANVLTGGSGNDTYVVGSGDTVTEASSAGTDTVFASVTWTLGSNVEYLILVGTSAIDGTGNTLANVIIGNAAANALNGGIGADTLIGSAGNDTYAVDNAADAIVEGAGEGVDSVNSSVTYTLAANVENLTLTGSSTINATGNALDNILTGNSANNTLTGGAGNDTLDGGAGNDTMVGGAGNDTYVVNIAADVVTELAGEGVDTVQSGVTLTLGNNVENLTLSGATAIDATGNSMDNVLSGNGANNTLTGAAGNDTLDGGAGTDLLLGGTGNDTYAFGRGYAADTVQENDAPAGNTDVLQFLSGVSSDQIWLTQVANDLLVNIIGSSDQMTIKDWYLGSQYHVEQFKTSDGQTLLDSKVQNLVNAMAAFAPPAMGQTTLPASYQASLVPVIAANWGP